MRRVALALSFMVAAPASAEPDVGTLYETLRLDEVTVLLREEGLGYGEDLRRDLFPNRPAGEWRRILFAVYDLDAMQRSVRERFAERLAETDVTPLVTFFTSATGARIVDLEISARRAMQDEEVADAAALRAAQMRGDGAPRMAQIDALIDANDLIGENVAGALNATYAFYAALAAGGAIEGAPSQTDLLADVIAQEVGIRADTIDWMSGFLNLAYVPLGDAELDAYIELSRTEAGQDLNAAIFEAYNEVQVALSAQLGSGAAALMAGEDL